MRTTSVLAAAAITAMLSAPLHAAPEQYVLEKPHTQILFFVSHLGFSKSQGEFLDFDGGFTFDSEDWGNSSVQVTIRTHSIDMDDHAWDKHMRDEDFFNVNVHPTMTFESTKLEKTGEKTGKLHGDLTLLGVTRPVTLDVTFNKVGQHFKSKEWIAGFSAATTIKRSEFGMKYGLPVIGDEVGIRLEVEGVRQ
ncbi:MAG: YceI family protein [Gammaproteobacteria bacterium]|nr:YceI family protein [Gammaproteobacteria bacterium]